MSIPDMMKRSLLQGYIGSDMAEARAWLAVIRQHAAEQAKGGDRQWLALSGALRELFRQMGW